MRRPMLTGLLLGCLIVPAVPAAAQAPSAINVQLSNFKFTPNRIVLNHGQPYVLRLSNTAGGGHNLTAPAFFAAANVDPADRKWVTEGEVEVPAGQVREIHLTAPGVATYKVKCSHALHKMFGMTGEIVVR